MGAPVLPPSPPSSAEADGELVISSSRRTFIAFYIDAARAGRIEPALARQDRPAHMLLERRGAATIVWTRAPAAELRDAVRACVPG